MTRFEISIEDAPTFSQKFVEKVQVHFIDVKDADIEFTNTPDMRVRKLFPQTGLGFRNSMRFEWQPQKERFIMYTQLSDYKLKSFGLSLDQAKLTKVMAANQGLYNGFLAAGLIWSILLGNAGNHIKIFFLVCVLIAGIYGGITASKKILFIHAFPAAIALMLVVFSY